MKKQLWIGIFLTLLSPSLFATEVKIKDLARFDGVRNNVLTGYGLVVGLAGTGDSRRSRATLQAVRNTLENFDLIVSEADLNSKNVAAVMVSVTLPAFAQEGDQLTAHVASLADAKSLSGGTLIVTPLKAVDGEVYALAQGPLSVGGYQFEKFDNLVQKNHPTVGLVTDGAIVERSLNNQFVGEDGSVYLILNTPDFSMVESITSGLNSSAADVKVTPIHASRIKLQLNPNKSLFRQLSNIENTLVTTQTQALIVINERTGTIVSGADIPVGNVVITHGSLKLTVSTEYQVSQPGAQFIRGESLAQTQVVPKTEIVTDENLNTLFVNAKATTIADVVDGLLKLNLTTRDIISVLQALNKSGAMHAKIIVE